MARYIMRLDDACERMNLENWQRIEELLDKYNIKPLIGVIPDCQDKEMEKYEKDIEFWSKVKKWEEKKWVIALHGYDHVYISREKGINPIHNRSEFAGVSYDIQKKKIKKGYNLLEKKGIITEVFFAPSHTFDLNTIRALKEETQIKIISDTIALKPYKKENMIFVPQQCGRVRNIPVGIVTFCYHPNNMKESEFLVLESFFKKHQSKFISILDINFDSLKKINLIDLTLQKIYFFVRKIKNIFK